MQKQKKNKNARAQAWGSVRLGSGFELTFAKPRIPRLLGAAEVLGNSLSVYPTVNLDIAIKPQQFSIAAGAVTGAIGFDPATIVNGYNTRFQAFREWVVLGANLEIRLNNVANTQGYILAYLDEKSSAAPTAAEATQRPRLDMTCGPLFERKPYRLQWTPRDLTDESYTPFGTSFSPCYLKVFASNADTFTGATTTGQIIVTGSLALQFRGYA